MGTVLGRDFSPMMFSHHSTLMDWVVKSRQMEHGLPVDNSFGMKKLQTKDDFSSIKPVRKTAKTQHEYRNRAGHNLQAL